MNKTHLVLINLLSRKKALSDNK